MAEISTKEIDTIFDNFLTKTIKKIELLYFETNMEDEHFATVASNVIASAMETSVNAYVSLKKSGLIDQQIAMSVAQEATELNKALDIASSTAVRNAQSEKDLEIKSKDMLLKDQQIAMSVAQEATELNKALDIASSTAVRDAQSGQDLLNKEAQRQLLLKQALKLAADTLFTARQTFELSRSVEFNNQIKALDSYADMIGTMGAGGLVISGDMWDTFFALIKSLNDATVKVEYPDVIAADIEKK